MKRFKMNRFSKTVYLMVLVPLFAVAAGVGEITGGQGSGGGFGLQCPGKPVLILDYYEATLPTLNGTPQLLSVDDKGLQETKAKIQSRLQRLPSFQQLILEKHKDISETKNWILADLNVIGDDTKTPYIECKKKFRVAYRQSGTVYLQKKLAPSLSDGQLFVLSLHEWFYASSGQSSSETVRQAIRELLKVDGDFTQARLNELVAKMLAKWQPVVVKVQKNVPAGDLATLDSACRENGASYVTFYQGSTYTQPNCGGDCTTWLVRELTCAQFSK